MAFTEDDKRITNLLNSSHREIARSFLNAVRSSKDSIKISELTTLLDRGDVEGVINLLETIPQALSIQVNLEYVKTGMDTSNMIASVISAPVVFDNVSNKSIQLMQESRLRLIREFSTSQRDLVRLNLTEGITRALNPRTQARMFRESIGLTAHQERVVRNYRRLLEERPNQALRRVLRDGRFDRTVIRAIENNKPIPGAKIDRMVQRYRERFIKYRSEVIARTESLRVVNQANNESFEQAFSSGKVNKEEIVRVWITAQDERVRGSHAGMHDQERPFDEFFETDAGNLLKYPGDESAPAEETIQCRCQVATRFR